MAMTFVCSRISNLEYQLDLASQREHTVDADSKDAMTVLEKQLDSKKKEITKLKIELETIQRDAENTDMSIQRFGVLFLLEIIYLNWRYF